jgi:hypothetical protein
MLLTIQVDSAARIWLIVPCTKNITQAFIMLFNTLSACGGVIDWNGRFLKAVKRHW